MSPSDEVTSSSPLITRLVMTVLLLVLWGVISGPVRFLALHLDSLIDSLVIATIINCLVLTVVAYALIVTFVRWAGVPRLVWLGIAILCIIEVGRLVLLSFGVGGWGSMDVQARQELFVSMAVPQLFAIAGAWLAQRTGGAPGMPPT